MYLFIFFFVIFVKMMIECGSVLMMLMMRKKIAMGKNIGMRHIPAEINSE